MEFYDGATFLGNDTISPYTYNWGNASTGTHTVTAKAITYVSKSTTSAAISVTATDRKEAEIVYVVADDAANQGNINQNTCAGTLSNSVVLSDADDAIQLPFTISQSGTYQLRVRVHSEFNGSPSAYFNGTNYTYKGNGVTQTFTGDLSTVTTTLSSCMGNSYWGEMVSANLSLSAGSNSVTVTSVGMQRAVDYLDVVLVSASARVSAEGIVPLSTVKVYPNPFDDRIRVELGENAGGTYQVGIVDALGRSYYERQHQLAENQTQLVLQLANRDMKSGLYLLQLNNGSQ